MAKRVEFTARLLRNETLAVGQRLLTFYCPAVASSARPGQFVDLATNRFLRRPLGICGVDREQGSFTVGGRAKGPGMESLLTLEPGAVVSLLGPLGNAFTWEPGDLIIACGGGTGVFPLHFLLEEARRAGCQTAVALGFKDRRQAILETDFRRITDCCLYASEAGDLDVAGTALDALERILTSCRPRQAKGEAVKQQTDGPVRLMTCGPIPMMQQAAAMADSLDIACQVSLEERMACGIGLCLVCACRVKDGEEGGSRYVRCCKEGPVFPAEEVVWPA